MSRFVEVAVPVPVEETYDYALPDDVEVEPGARVLVPYRGRQIAAFVLSVTERPSSLAPGRIREVISAIDPEPLLSAQLLRVILRGARDALCPPGIALAAAVPPGTAPRIGRRVELLDGGRRALEHGEARGTLGKVLWSIGRGPVREDVLRSRFPAAVPVLDRLERIGWIRRTRSTEAPRVRPRTERVYRVAEGVDPEDALAQLSRSPRRRELLELLHERGPSPVRASAALRALVERGLVTVEEREVMRRSLPPPLAHEAEVPTPTRHQRDALDAITTAIERGRDATFLLYGITGSGKTEVYLRATAEALARDRSAIVLVPEISLTHQLVDRFRARFGDQVAVLHSGLSDGERYDQWRGLREGAYPIAIGARSAVFAPLAEPGLIVIDEEHDGAYKSEEGFRYHAREIALLRAQAARCPLVLGSATPDVETSYRADLGEIERLVLPERVTPRPLPEVQIIDMEAENRRTGKRRVLSRPLRQALAETLAAGNQAILFLNRRGFATLSYCFECGHSLRCKHCDISLVYHSTAGTHRPDRLEEGELRCHYCGYKDEPSLECPSCGSVDGGLLGFGTERLEEEVATLFSHARVARLDGDTSSRKGAQRKILARFHQREIDVLVGTQMVAKGHDVPGVTLVGVVAADLGLHFPDLRAGERTFQLLTQVAGRAGRGEEPGRVLIQSFLPEHYSIALARTHDYPAFYKEELERRRPHGYPPWKSMVQVGLSGLDEAGVEAAAGELATLARSVPLADDADESVAVLGPAPAPIARIRDRFRWQLLLLGGHESTRSVARELIRLARGRFRGVRLRVDPSPLQML